MTLEQYVEKAIADARELIAQMPGASSFTVSRELEETIAWMWNDDEPLEQATKVVEESFYAGMAVC